MNETQYISDFLAPRDAWDKLSIEEQAAMMKAAVSEGILDLGTIRQKYNEFAEGGSKEEEEGVNTIVPFTQRREVIITPDSEYNQYLNTLPDNQRFTPNDKYDSYFYWKLNGRPRNFEEAYNKGMFHYDHSDNAYHANSIAFDDNTGVGYFMKPKTHDTVGYELDWFNKGLVTEEGGKQRPVTPEEAIELEEFRKNYFLTNDPDRPNYYRYQPIEKANGGSIHIKPSHKGRLTELKERTGKSEAELYNDGNPAHKKMVVFARNARKWKHGLGGNLFDGTSQPSQKMKIGRPYYSYDENGRKIDDTLNYNISFPEVVIIPDSKKSPAERAVLERERRRNNDAYYGRGTYNAKVDREQTELEKNASQKAWENSIEKQALGYAQAAATGVGIGADIVSGLPIYSSLKGARVLSEAETPMDYAEGALWLAPIAGVAGREAWNTGKQVAGKVAEAARPIIDNEGVAITNPFTGDINWIGKGLGSYIEVSPTSDGWLGVDYINSTRSGTGRKLYDAAIKEAHKRGLKGVKSGESLLSAPKTYNIWEHYPDRVLISNTGSHGNGNMINGEVTIKVNTPEELIEATKRGIDAAVIKKAPVYGLTTPSSDVPFLSISRAESVPRYNFRTPSKSVGLAEEDNALINDLLDKFAPKESEGVKAMSIAEREKGYQRMKEFINSPEYQQRLEAAGLGNYKDYMIELIENRLNGNNFFPAWRADKILGKNYRGMSEVDPSSYDYGVTVRSDLQGNDFLQTLDHELAHWSTENTPPGLLKNIWYSLYHEKKPNFKVQKMMEANDKVAPVRTWEDYYNSQYGNLSKKELEGLKDEIKKAKRKFKYLSSGQERRARAYAMTQEAKRRGISTDELVDMYTVEDELMGEAPKGLLELSRVYTPENLKKYLKGFLSVATPVTLGLNAYKNE